MGKIAFVFSGQGDQYPGMGKELVQRYPAAEAVFDLCDKLRPGTTEQCFFGTEEELQKTQNTQPCLFAMELAAAAVLQENGIVPHAVAGFSLGEMSAAAFCQLFSTETAFRLVCRRAQLMQQESEKQDCSMAAVVKLNPQQLQDICKAYSAVYPVNFNAPGQITVSGLSEQMADFAAQVKAAGGKAIPLKVKGAFHSPFMGTASEAFARELMELEIKESPLLLYSNVTAEPYGKNAAELLSRQICSPVQWEKIIRNMIADGVDDFIEIGPGRTLCNMIKRISSEGTIRHYSDILKEAEKC